MDPTCDASNLALQVGPYEPGQVSPQADTDEVNGAQRGSFLLQATGGKLRLTFFSQ